MTPAYDTDILAASAAISRVMQRLATRIHYAKDEEIFAQSDRADLVYLVTAGAVRTTRLLNDGRRTLHADVRAIHRTRGSGRRGTRRRCDVRRGMGRLLSDDVRHHEGRERSYCRRRGKERAKTNPLEAHRTPLTRRSRPPW